MQNSTTQKEIKSKIGLVESYGSSNNKKAVKYYNIAVDLEAKNKLGKAEEYYKKALIEDSCFVDAYDNLGLIYRRLNNYSKAIECYSKSIELYPSGQVAHQNLAVVYKRQEQYQKAISEYQKIVKIDPNNPEGYYGLAQTYKHTNNLNAAARNAKKAISIYKKSNSEYLGDGYYLLALIYYLGNDYEQAQPLFIKAEEKGVEIDEQIKKYFNLD